MRKRCKRISRPDSVPIHPYEHTDLMLGSRLHLEMVLTQPAVLDYMYSVMGIFNIAFALAYLQNNSHVLHQFEVAQMSLMGLIQEKRSPNQDEGNSLRQYFNQADRYIGIQNRATLVRAIGLVNHVAGKDGGDSEGRQLKQQEIITLET